MNDYEVGDGLCIVNGGFGQVSGDVVCVEQGVLRVRWDNHYRDPHGSFKSADVRYHIKCRDIDDSLNLNDNSKYFDEKYELNSDNEKYEPIGGYNTKEGSTSAASNEESQSGRADDCLIQ